MKTKARGLKKAFAVIMALAVVLSYSMIPAFAATSTKTGTLNVSKLDSGATVKAYKIVTANDDSSTNVVLTKTENGKTVPSIKDVEHPTEAEIKALMGRTSELGTPVTLQEKGTTGEYEATNVPAGMYLVIIENAKNNDTKIYMPLVLSINVKDGAAQSTPFVLNDGDKFQPTDEDPEGYVKSQKPTVTKVVDRDTEANSNANNGKVTGDEKATNGEKGDTAGKGDKVWFKIGTAIPGYDFDYYTNPVFKVNDTLSAGLKFNSADLTVKVGTTDYTVADTAGDDVINWEKNGDDGFVLNFGKNVIKNNPNAAVVVKYSATVQDNCQENFDAETNTASITYTNKPGQEVDSDEIKTYHYTFSINGKLRAKDSEVRREVVKVGIDQNGDFVLEETEAKTESGWKNLEGAKFDLYKASDIGADNKPVAGAAKVREDVESNDEGLLIGLDRLDAGEYKLIETYTPAPYAKNETPIPITIEAELNADGQLKSYKITVDGIVAGSYEASYENNVVTDVSVQDDYDDTADIRNSKTGTLPSTGGMGTVLFTVAGIALMAIAAGLLLASRRRNSEEE